MNTKPMNHNLKKSIAAALALMVMAPAAYAGEVNSDTARLVELLVQKHILTPDEAQQITQEIVKEKDEQERKESAEKVAKADQASKAGKFKFESELYLNTTARQVDSTTAGVTTTTKTSGLNVDRVYLTAKYNFNDNWMARVTTDVGNESSLGHRQNVYLKYAYVEGKLAGDTAVLRLGQSHTPWIDYEEHLWGHRYVAKTMIDQYGFDDSSDLGVGLKGALADGKVNYWVTATNGTGYGKGNVTSGHQSVDFNSRLGFNLVKGLTFDLQYRDGRRNTKTSINDVSVDGVKSTLFQGMLTYSGSDDWRVGANYINNDDKASSANPGTSFRSHGGSLKPALPGDKLSSTGYALWGHAKLPRSKLGVFAKYDDLQNELTSAGVKSNKEKVHHYLVGLEYYLTKGVDFSLVYDQTKVTDRAAVIGDTSKDSIIGLFSHVYF